MARVVVKEEFFCIYFAVFVAQYVIKYVTSIPTVHVYICE